MLLAQQLLLEQAVKNVEDQLDNTLQALDNMDPDDLEAMRQRRLDQMKRAAAQRQEWSRKGHGEYKEIFGERGFFAEMKGEERMVCHFYRENWPCKVGASPSHRLKFEPMITIMPPQEDMRLKRVADRDACPAVFPAHYHCKGSVAERPVQPSPHSLRGARAVLMHAGDGQASTAPGAAAFRNQICKGKCSQLEPIAPTCSRQSIPS